MNDREQAVSTISRKLASANLNHLEDANKHAEQTVYNIERNAIEKFAEYLEEIGVLNDVGEYGMGIEPIKANYVVNRYLFETSSAPIKMRIVREDVCRMRYSVADSCHLPKHVYTDHQCNWDQIDCTNSYIVPHIETWNKMVYSEQPPEENVEKDIHDIIGRRYLVVIHAPHGIYDSRTSVRDIIWQKAIVQAARFINENEQKPEPVCEYMIEWDTKEISNETIHREPDEDIKR